MRISKCRLGEVGVIGFVLAAAVSASAAPPPAASAPAPAADGSPMDPALGLLARAHQFYQGVQDYTCLFVKREQVNGQVLPENLIAMKVRTRPFSVHLRWLGPKPQAGQEACYVAGRNNNMMRARASGVLGAVGFVSMPLNDPRALNNNRHTLAEAGIGNLIDQLARHWQEARRTGQAHVRLGEYEYNKRRCTRVEVTMTSRPGNGAYAYRSVVYFDKENALPIRIEAYDWPRQGGPPQGDLLESYSYVDLRFNVRLGDRDFSY
jgi:hypothetical protein